MSKQITLIGRIIITGNIQVITGLHVGGSKEGVSIGGVDNPVIRDLLSNQPYVPGSSLKGKLRSLAEKRGPNLQFNYPRNSQSQFHVCETEAEFASCPVCKLYGVPGEKPFATPTRLVVRDVRLTEDSVELLRHADTDVPFTEVKYEVAIDRITSRANPRPLERVPAGATFGPFEMILSLYEKADAALLDRLFEAMQLLEDDYLGGAGSRGSGKVAFRDLAVLLKPVAAYANPDQKLDEYKASDLAVMRANLREVVEAAEKMEAADG